MENGFEINKDLLEDNTADTVNTEEKEPVKITEISANAPVQAPAQTAGRPSAQKKRKRKGGGTVKSIIWVLVIVVISLSIAFGVIYAGADYLGIGFGRGKACVIDVPQGSSTAQIADILSESGTVKLPVLFRLYSKIKHYDSKYKYGVFSFNNELGYEGIADMLMEGGAVAETKTVTIPEMSSVDDIAKILAENGICDTDDFIDEVQSGNFEYDFIKDIPVQSVYYRLEGYLFPDTYSFYVCEDSRDGAHLAINTMLSTLDEKIKNLRQDIDSSKYSFHEIMTMASIVELEAGGSPEDMAKVAAVFYNRLESDDFSTLGSSPTKKYPHGNGRYDTYNVPGLPPGPLCSPSLASIKAAVNPEKDFPYFYFVTDKSMKFYYRKTLAEHNAIIAKLQAEGNWIYEYFD